MGQVWLEVYGVLNYNDSSWSLWFAQGQVWLGVFGGVLNYLSFSQMWISTAWRDPTEWLFPSWPVGIWVALIQTRPTRCRQVLCARLHCALCVCTPFVCACVHAPFVWTCVWAPFVCVCVCVCMALIPTRPTCCRQVQCGCFQYMCVGYVLIFRVCVCVCVCACLCVKCAKYKTIVIVFKRKFALKHTINVTCEWTKLFRGEKEEEKKRLYYSYS